MERRCWWCTKSSCLCMLSMSIALMNLFILCRSLPHSRSHQNNSIIGRLKRMKIGLMLILSCRLILQYIKARAAACAVRGACGSGGCGGRDLDAMTALCKVRTNDFIDLKSQLEDQMTLDNHHQVSQI